MKHLVPQQLLVLHLTEFYLFLFRTLIEKQVREYFALPAIHVGHIIVPARTSGKYSFRIVFLNGVASTRIHNVFVGDSLLTVNSKIRDVPRHSFDFIWWHFHYRKLKSSFELKKNCKIKFLFNLFLIPHTY